MNILKKIKNSHYKFTILIPVVVLVLAVVAIGIDYFKLGPQTCGFVTCEGIGAKLILNMTIPPAFFFVLLLEVIDISYFFQPNNLLLLSYWSFYFLLGFLIDMVWMGIKKIMKSTTR